MCPGLVVLAADVLAARAVWKAAPTQGAGKSRVTSREREQSLKAVPIS